MTTLTTTTTLGEIVANREYLSTDANTTIFDAVCRMASKSKGAILLTQNGRLAGVFTERDLMTRVVAKGLDPAKTPLRDVMTTQLVVARPFESYQSGLEKMAHANCRHLPVIDGDRVIGLVSRRELMALDIRVTEALMERTEPSSLLVG